MSDEQRDISINVKATGAIRDLTRVGDALDGVSSLAGKTDAQLTRAERTIQRAADTSVTAARTMAQLKNTLRELSAETTTLNNANSRLSARLLTANKRLAEQKSIVATQRVIINDLVRANLKLSGTYDAIAASAGRATAAARTQANLSNQFAAAKPLAVTPFGISQGGRVNLADATKQLESEAKAAALAEGGLKKVTQSAVTLRNTVVSASYSLGLLGVGLLALEAIPTAVAIQFDQSFASVRRTVSGATDETKSALANLSEQIPVSFKDLAGIATLGGQLGLGASQIVDFTRVVAELTATTDLTADAAGTLIGRFASFYHLPADQFENLASSILKVGVTSVATESQIATLATRLAGAGQTLHLSAQEVIGFSAALASVAVRPYAAAGTFNRFAGVIRNAVANGGSQLQLLAKIAGTTSDDFVKSFNNGTFDHTFTKLIEGMGDVKKTGGDAVNVLTQLGLTGVTDAQTFRQLAAAPEAVKKAFDLANSAYAQNIELQRQYNITTDTTAAKTKKLENSFLAYANALGQDGANLIGAVAPKLTNLLILLTDLANNPVAGAILGGGGLIAAFAGLAAILGAGLLRGYAGILGITSALEGFRGEAVTSGGAIAALRAELALTGPAGAVAAKGIGAATIAIKALTKAAIAATVFLGAVELISWADNLNKKATPAALKITSVAKSAQEMNKYFTDTNDLLTQQGADFYDVGSNATRAANGYSKLTEQQRAIADVLDQGANKGLKLPNLLGDNNSKLAEGAITNVDKALAGLVKSGNAKDAISYFNDIQKAAGGAGQTTIQYGAYQVKLTSLFPAYTAALKQYVVQTNAAANANKSIADGTLNVTKTLRDLLGLSSKSKFIGTFATSFAKAVQPLTDFNTVLGEVQAAQKAHQSLQAYAVSQNKDQVVSLSKVTDQLNMNNDAQKTWQSNLIQLSQLVSNDPAFGTDGAQQIVSTLIGAGYSVTNASFLQQLVNATPEQRDAYITANQEALALAGKEAANTLLASPYLTQGGHKIGVDTANAIADGLSKGLPLDFILQQLNIQFGNTPLVPKVDTLPATADVNTFVQGIGAETIAIPVRADTNAAAAQIAAFQAAIAANPLYINTVLRPPSTKNLQGTYGHGLGVLPVGGNTGGLVGRGTILPGFAHGAVLNRSIIHGPGTGKSDSILARVANGESITNARAVQYYGTPMMDAINRMKFPKFSGGGFPGGVGSTNGAGAVINATVIQNYPTTRDPIKTLKTDAQNVLAGIWN